MAKRDDRSPATKGDLKAVKGDLQTMEARILHRFEVVVENLRHDVLGASRDEIEVVKDRVTRLERHAGLMKAA